MDGVRHVYDGEEVIEVEVYHPTTSVSLHIKELLIKTASFIGADGATIEVEHIAVDLKLHVLTLTFAKQLPLGG